MWEVPFSRHLEVFDDGEREGLFVATDNKYGASVRNGEIGVTLIRSPRMTGLEPGHERAWPQSIARNRPALAYTDQGRHRIRLVLGRHAASLPRERQPAAVAETQFTPPLAYTGGHIASPLHSLTGDESLLPAWAQPLEPGKAWLLRLHEVIGQRGQAILHTAPGWTARVAGAEGQPSGKPSEHLAVAFKPYGIHSIRFDVVC